MKINSCTLVILILLVITCSYATAQVTSTFNANAEGWTTPNDADGTIAYSATGGNPGGFVAGSPFQIVLGATTLYVPFNFVAPAAYRGNRSTYYNGTLQYDIQQSTTGTPNQYPEVTIANSLGIILYYFPATSNQPPAAPAWATYSVVFNNTLGFWKTTNSATGPAATELQIQNVLADLANLEIRGLYRDANTINRLDNVSFRPPITITLQPASTAVCSGVTAALTTTATNNPAITYQWQRETTPGVWTNVTNTGGYTGATTNTLFVNTTGNFGAGSYRCQISGTAVSNVISAAASITINTLPNAPTTTGNTSCTAASLALTAAGGTAGQYRWYTVSTGGTAITGQTNSTFNTPVISVSTTYFVAINNGTCESTRTPVTATILTPPAKPVIAASQPINAGVVAICLQPVILSAPAGFTTYTWSTGQTSQQVSTTQPGNFTVTVTGANGCNSPASDPVQVINNTTCINNPPNIIATSVQTFIGGNITIDLSTLISDPDGNLDPASLQVVNNSTQRGGTTTLNGFNLEIDYSSAKFSGNDFATIRVCDLLNVCFEANIQIEVFGDIVIYNGISPNGDLNNDFWEIKFISLFPDTQNNRVNIYNRWGDLVWEGNNYDNDNIVFTGLSKNGNELSTGTYFYKIEFTGGRETITGYLSLKR